MFVFTTRNLKKLPLRTKIGLFLAIVLGITLLVFFGITFLVIALIGGLVTWVANLFRDRRAPRPLNDPFHSHPQPRKSPRRYDDDDVIDGGGLEAPRTPRRDPGRGGRAAHLRHLGQRFPRQRL